MKTKIYVLLCFLKWFIKELIKIYSNEPSFFSKKRIESGIAFMIAEWGAVFFLVEKLNDLSMSDFVLWICVQFAVAGYIIYRIQREKIDNSNNQ